MRQAQDSAVAIPDTAVAPATGMFYGWWIVAASHGEEENEAKNQSCPCDVHIQLSLPRTALSCWYSHT